MSELLRHRRYNEFSFSEKDLTTFHGRPECPACGEGRLLLWRVGMAYHSPGSPDGYDSAPPPDLPNMRYEATLMVCRERYDEKPGCGFTLTLQGPRSVDLSELRTVAEYIRQSATSAHDEPSTR